MNAEITAAPPMVQRKYRASTATRPVPADVKREKQARTRNVARVTRSLSWRDKWLYGATIVALLLIATLCAVLTGYQLGVGHEARTRAPLQQQLVDATAEVGELRRQLEAQQLDLKLQQQQANSDTLTVEYLRLAHLELQSTLAEQRDELALYRSMAQPAAAGMPALSLRDPVIVGDVRNGFDIEVTLLQPGGTEAIDVLTVATLWMHPLSDFGSTPNAVTGNATENARPEELVSGASVTRVRADPAAKPSLSEATQPAHLAVVPPATTPDILLAWVSDLNRRNEGLSTGSVMVSLGHVPMLTPQLLTRVRSAAPESVVPKPAGLIKTAAATEVVELPPKAIEFDHAEHRLRFFKRVAMGLELPERLRRNWLPDRVSLAIYPAGVDTQAATPLLVRELEWTSHYRPAHPD